MIELTKRLGVLANSRLGSPSLAGILRLCAGLILVGAVAGSLLVPIGNALWSQVLGMTGKVHTGDFPQPGPGQGCTPGFWKQPQHFGNWPDGYSPEDLVSDVFAVPATGNPTMLEALETGGGGEAAFLRHAVAALLNAVHPDVNFPLASGQVIQLVQDAYASGDFEQAKDELEPANELGCDLSRIKDVASNVEGDPQQLAVQPTMTPTPAATDTPVAFQACPSSRWSAQEDWPAPYTQDTPVSVAFDVQLSEELSLFAALQIEGADLGALMRESATALLNAASEEVDFELSAEEVVAYFQAAHETGDPQVIAATASRLQEINDGDCPLPQVEIQATATDTPTPTATESPKRQGPPTAVATATPTSTATATVTATSVSTATDTAEPPATDTPEPQASDTPEPTATATPEPPPTDTPTPTATDTPEPSPTDTPEPTPTSS